MSFWEVVGIVLLVLVALQVLPVLLGLTLLILVRILATVGLTGGWLMNRVWGVHPEDKETL